MKVLIRELDDGSAVIETQYGQQLSYFKNLKEAQYAYSEWYLNFDASDDDDTMFLT